VDLDAYVGARSRQWARLEHLVQQRRLSGAEGDELLELYQQVSTDLSVVRSASPDPSVVAYLSMLLTRARLTMVGARTSTWADALRFFTHTFPGALYRTRRWWVTCALLNVAFAVGVALWTMNHPEVYTNQLSPAEVRAYVDTDFANYYREFPHHEFATLVWVNNAWVAAQCIAFGVLGLPVLWVLAQNTLNVGVIGALMAGNDRTSLFFGLILPHGLLELTAVFVAGATGLRLFWSWVEPGPRTRLQALAAEGRAAVGIALGLVAVLFVSGVIEGFVTPSGLPTWARVGIGVAAELLFVAYVFVVGRRAHGDGATGDLEAREVGDTAPVAG
jgi:uncharacterized membrane protein SpoIIM required for sporulation